MCAHNMPRFLQCRILFVHISNMSDFLTAPCAVSPRGRHTQDSAYWRLLEAPFSGSTSPMCVSSLLCTTLLLPSEMFNGTPQSSGPQEHPLVPVFTNGQAETDLSNLLITQPIRNPKVFGWALATHSGPRWCCSPHVTPMGCEFWINVFF